MSSPDDAGPTVMIKGGEAETRAMMLVGSGDETYAAQEAIGVGKAEMKGATAGEEKGVFLENEVAVNGRLHHTGEYDYYGGDELRTKSARLPPFGHTSNGRSEIC